MLRTKNITHTFEMRVYTDQGEYFGDVEECIITINKIFGWRVKATRGSSLSGLLGGAKGVIVPHQLVKAVGDVFIINKAAIPSYGESGEEEKEEIVEQERE
tara:strand:+ start:117 stop:419 length:303 start_codon:yes stop_codon:yes gene_type:complete